jgi:integral membrane protein
MSVQRTGSHPVASRLRLVSILETISFLALLTMMLSHNDLGVSIAGAIHGLLFLGYAVLVFRDRDDLGWTGGFAALAILTGPLGPIIVLEKLRRT